MEQEGQPALPDMELHQIIEGLTGHERVQEKRRLLSEIEERQQLIKIIDDINESEGIDVSIIY